ncbi:hypothetical protein AB0J86_19805 [Micromonospora sp. NPDC049559]|uniref:hypothetical protein n=1 Tax=Micromonospora sp. NPDC049559 TaxID=3155923 RepID=UPI00341F6B6C
MTVGGYLHMDVELVEPVLHGLSGTGAELDAAWQAGRAAVAAGEAGIGGDALGQAFRGIYLADSAAVRDNAGRFPGVLREDGQVGTDCVADYVAADARSAAAFAGVGGR